MSDITHIAYVNPTTGHINRLDMAMPNNPEEGLSPTNSEEYIIHIDSDFVWPIFGPEDSQQSGFLKNYYWDFSTSSWEYRGPPPNVAGVWTGSEWTYDQTAWLNYIRFLRDNKLAVCDWTQMPDADLTELEIAEAREYRQALRNLPNMIAATPENYSSENVIPWPTPPSFITS